MNHRWFRVFTLVTASLLGACGAQNLQSQPLGPASLDVPLNHSYALTIANATANQLAVFPKGRVCINKQFLGVGIASGGSAQIPIETVCEGALLLLDFKSGASSGKGVWIFKGGQWKLWEKRTSGLSIVLSPTNALDVTIK